MRIQVEDLKNAKKILFVDQLKVSTKKVCQDALSSGVAVVYLYIDAVIKTQPWFVKAEKAGNIREFSWHIFPYYLEWQAEDHAFDTIEEVFGKALSESRLPTSSLRFLYQEDDADLCVKKILIMQLAYYFKVNKAYQALVEINVATEFFPSNDWMQVQAFAKLSQSKDLPPAPPIASQFQIGLSAFKEKFFALAMLFAAPFFLLTRLRRITWQAVQPQKKLIAFRVYQNDLGLHDKPGVFSIDWLVEGSKLPKEQSLFVAETEISADYQTKLSTKYAFTQAHYKALISNLSVGALFKIFRHVFSAWFRLMSECQNTSPEMILEMVKALMVYVQWQSFLQQWRPKFYVTYNHIQPNHICRNILFRQHGIETVYYNHSVSDRNIRHYSQDKATMRRTEWAYLMYDKQIHWGRRDANIVRISFGRSREYLEVGPIWTPTDEDVARFSKLMREKLPHEGRDYYPIVTTLDTAVDGHVPTDERGYIQYLAALEALLADPRWPKLLLILKAKLYWETMKKNSNPLIVAGLERLRAHPRFLMFEGTVMTALPMSISDFILPIAFATPGVEALGLNKKMVYFDSAGRFRQSYYDLFPKMVAHSQEELMEFIDYWLGLSPKEHEAYLQKYVAPEFANRLDNKAKLRIREMLEIPG